MTSLRALVPTLGSALLGLALAAPVHAREKIDDQLVLMEEDVRDLQIRVDRLQINFSERPNLIGADEARERYEEALYLYMLEEYSAAANAFYILVQARSLRTLALEQDSEWYLGDCLFEIGNLRTAAEVFKIIADKGPTHPFFSDSVRRLLEIYAILGDTERFDSYYNTYIVTGRVRTTDLIVYTLAKSFRLRGERDRAISTFNSIPAGSPWYSRARYFLAVMSLEVGDRDNAIAEFLKVEAVTPGDSAAQAVHDEAVLNLGALYLEAGDYPKAAAYNVRLPANNPLFPEQLYQAIWGAVKQDDLDVALAEIDTFLVQFPDDRRAASLKIIQGKLLMKKERYDDARAVFDTVVGDYSPVVTRLGTLAESPADLQQFLSEAGNEKAASAAGLPRAVVEEVRGREEVGRAVTSFEELQAEKEGLVEAERMIAEVQVALTNSGDTLGTFSAARTQLKTVRLESLAIRSRLLDTEATWLARRVPSASRAAVLQLQTERQKVVEEAVSGQSSSASGADRVAAYDDQVREVQQRASRIQRVIRDLQDQADALARTAATNSSGLDADELASVREQIAAQQAQLDAANRALAEVQGDGMRRALTRSVEESSAGDDHASATARSYADIRSRLAPYRRQVTESGASAWFDRMDALWAALDKVDAGANAAEAVLDGTEDREVAAVKQRLSDQTGKVKELREEILADSADIETFTAKVVAAGMREVRVAFAGTVMEGDRGVVDVYWARKLAVHEELERLQEAENEVLDELDMRYRILLAGLEQ